VVLAVRAIPRSRADGLDGWRGGRLVVRVTAPPLEGRANEALRRVIAAAAGVAMSQVEVLRGPHSREKTVRVRGRAADELWRALGRPAHGQADHT
jgi:uncharacterized protein (TIGR00251 family)